MDQLEKLGSEIVRKNILIHKLKGLHKKILPL